ncbi:hypothetical protein [Nocardioides sp.]|uniref:hypothetical protein n=1 Tax=Nocardioides sp. TaxID=35761 RepID=UPI003561574C
MPDSSPYSVVILLEEGLTSDDATRVRSLHEGIEDPVAYHVLLPLDDAPARLQAAMGGIGVADPLSGQFPLPEIDVREIVAQVREDSQRALDQTLEALRATGATAQGTLVTLDPIDALSEKVTEVDAREAIIITEPHVVAEFFHVDWTSQARRRVGVPILHLLEHENFDEQAGGGEGISGL